MQHLSIFVTKVVSMLIFLVNPNGKFNLISWQSKTIKQIVRSSLAAATLVMLNSIDSALCIPKLIHDLFYSESKNTKLIHCIKGITNCLVIPYLQTNMC